MRGELRNGASPFESLECRAARDRIVRRRGQARNAGGDPGARRQGWNIGGLRMRTALLACSAVICCCAVAGLAAGRRTCQDRRARPHRAQGRQAGQPDPRPPRAAAPEGEPRARARGERPHGRHAAHRLPQPLLERRDADGDARAPLHRRRLGRREHRRRHAQAQRRPQGRAHVDGTRRATGPCCCRRAAAASASASDAGKLGGAQGRGLHGRSRLRGLTGPARRRLASPRT